jgi:hypothetical protein
MKRVTNFDMLYSPMASGAGLEPYCPPNPSRQMHFAMGSLIASEARIYDFSNT